MLTIIFFKSHITYQKFVLGPLRCTVRTYIHTYMHTCKYVESSSLAGDTQSAECRFQQCSAILLLQRRKATPRFKLGGRGRARGNGGNGGGVESVMQVVRLSLCRQIIRGEIHISNQYPMACEEEIARSPPAYRDAYIRTYLASRPHES